MPPPPTNVKKKTSQGLAICRETCCVEAQLLMHYIYSHSSNGGTMQDDSRMEYC